MKSQKYGCYTRGPSAFSIVGTQRHCQRYSAWFLFMISCVLMMGDVNSYQLVTKNTEPSQKEAKRLGLNKQCSLQTCCCPFSANIWSLTKKKSPFWGTTWPFVMLTSSVWRVPPIKEITQQSPRDVSYFDYWKVHAGSGGGSHWFIFATFPWLTAI